MFSDSIWVAWCCHQHVNLVGETGICSIGVHVAMLNHETVSCVATAVGWLLLMYSATLISWKTFCMEQTIKKFWCCCYVLNASRPMFEHGLGSWCSFYLLSAIDIFATVWLYWLKNQITWGGLSPGSSGLDGGEKNMTCLGYPGVDLKDNQGDKQSALVSAIPYIRVSSISFSQNIVACWSWNNTFFAGTNLSFSKALLIGRRLTLTLSNLNSHKG
jgi:hypothetical protein